MLTTKFKLDLPAGCPLREDAATFDKCRKLYDVVEGCGNGTLTGFLFAVILSGFRIFPDGKLAEIFSNSSVYDEDAFRIALTEAVGAPLPQFTVKALIKRLQQEVRARGGKDNRFVPEVMAKEYKLTLCGKLLPKGVDETYVDRVFEEIAQELTTRYHSWNELKSDLLGACEAVDTALRGFGDFPSLASMAAQAASHKLPKDSTIVFDPQLPFIDVQKIGVDAMPYAVVSALLSYPESVGEQRREFVQSHLTTASAAGLSWLFNRGLELFSEESVEELCRLFQVPEDQAFRVTQIQNAARMTPKQSFFLKKGGTPLGYHDFRSAFAGRINSWTANYLNRLEELQGLLHDLTDELRLPDLVREGEDFLATTDCRREEAEVLCCSFAMKRDRAKTAVEHLLGADPMQVANDVAAIEECSRIVNRLYAIREQIVNALLQAEDDKASRWNTLWSEVKGEFAPWEKFIRLPKLNGMSGGVPPAQEELDAILNRYETVARSEAAHFDAVMEWATKARAEGNVLAKIAETEQQRADQRAPGKYDGRELALRWVLQRVARVVRDRSDACAEDVRQWFVKENVFAERKDFNKFFSNRLGSLYVSPFSNRRHEGYKLTAGLTERSDAVWNALLAFVKEKKDTYAPLSEAGETFLRLESLLMGMRISALTKNVPVSIAALHLDDETVRESVSEGLKLQLRQAEVPPSVLVKAFNVYVSLLSGCLIALRRERFFLRTKFSLVGNTALVYVPKEKSWSMPARYEASPAWTPIFENDVLVRLSTGEVEVAETFRRAAALWGQTTDPAVKKALRELFHQMPHDWCYQISVRSSDGKTSTGRKEDDRDVLIVEKKGKYDAKILSKKIAATALARLVGPSTHKERLNRLLLDVGEVACDMTLLADQEVLQKVEDGRTVLSLGKLQFSLSVPISAPAEQNEDEMKSERKSTLFKRIVAIDQGERGFAYAVFRLEDAGKAGAQPLATGFVNIPSIRRLIARVHSFRKSKQSVQKFSQRFDSTMFTLRENVAGDVCGSIAGLMCRYRAIPVLERQVSNLASGGKQLELVYKMVNARFLDDRIPMHSLERTSWWCGTSDWVLPDLWVEVPESYAAKAKKGEILDKDGKFYRTLRVTPGAAVNAKWTSRICSQCGGNAMELIEKAREEKVKTVTLDENGEVTLFGKTLRLYKRPSEEQSRKARRRNERAPWTEPRADVKLSLDDFRRAVAENMRRQPKSLQSKDTSQSRYFCVFTDCCCHNQEQHADINAAINIGRRFLESLMPK